MLYVHGEERLEKLENVDMSLNETLIQPEVNHSWKESLWITFVYTSQ
jgi:hypothetical protein